MCNCTNGNKPGAIQPDGTSAIARTRYSALLGSLTITNPAANQSEGGVVGVSRDGRALKHAAANSILVREQNPLFYAPGFRGDIGVNLVRAAKVVTVNQSHGYAGQFPIREQPTLTKPKPWKVRADVAGKI